MKLGIDLDGCLADFNSSFGDALIEQSGETLFREDWKTSPEWPTSWNYHYDAGYTKEDIDRVWRNIHMGGTFWRGLKPYDGAPETVKQLNRLAGYGHDVYYLTHRSGKKAKVQTEEWLNSLGMEFPTVILTGVKLPVLVNLGIDFFVDDKIETVNEVHGYYHDFKLHGSIFLKDAPYNRAGREPGLQVVGSVAEALQRVELWQEPKRGRPRILVP